MANAAVLILWWAATIDEHIENPAIVSNMIIPFSFPRGELKKPLSKLVTLVGLQKRKIKK